jgi:hypothetical protein
MFSGVSRNVVKIRLIRLGSCRSTIELRPQFQDLLTKAQAPEYFISASDDKRKPRDRPASVRRLREWIKTTSPSSHDR